MTLARIFSQLQYLLLGEELVLVDIGFNSNRCARCKDKIICPDSQ